LPALSSGPLTLRALHGGASRVLAAAASQKVQEGDHGMDAHSQKISSACDPYPGGQEQYMSNTKHI
jgi:hypothetical protein